MTVPGTVQQALAAIRTLQAQLDARTTAHAEPIAIVGVGCRYPGAAGPDAYWDLLMRGGDAVTDTPPERWDAAALYSESAAAPGTIVTRRGGFVEVERFDAGFFGISPREAPHVDPRQRLMLEVTWEALEHAGLAPHRLAGSATGVFVATLTNDYDHLLFSDLRRIEGYSGAGTANSVVANRISYLLDLRGPSLSLDTACSGSLVALHLACESLRAGESTAAIVGGVSVNLMPKSNVFFSRAGALSPSGRCATFDAGADGMVRSDGAGVVILKTLDRALADGDRVLAVIAGSAINHDGRSNGIMAPNGEAQVAVLAAAYRRSGIPPGTVQFIEAHGTGTKLGDPIEVQALAAVLLAGRPEAHPCVLGAVKTNIGHTEAAAGIAGVIKTALALSARTLPPTIHFEHPNPLLGLDQLPFVVRTAAGPWPSPDQPLVAGVSGFGFGGANAHVVLTEAPAAVASPAMAPPFVLPVSARDPAALVALAAALSALLRSGRLDTGDICRTAATGRTHYPFRLSVVGDSAEELAAALDARAATPVSVPAEPPRLAFVFSGQGSHWPQMGMDLYAREPVFRAALEHCDRAIAALTGRSTLDTIRQAAAASALNRTEIAQPALFALQVALAALWYSWDITPEAITGHSLGEIAAACSSGALSVEDGARIVCVRSGLMARVAGRGATAVVSLPLDETRHALARFDPAVTVAGSNGPTTTVISGEPGELANVQRSFEQQGIFCREIPGVDIAFHSAQMDPLLGDLVGDLAGVTPGETVIPLVSTVTGQGIAGSSLGPLYWGRNLREPFLFTQAMLELLARGCTAFIEISPHAVLGSAMVQTIRHARREPARVFPSLQRGGSGARSMYTTLAALYEAGHEVRWDAVFPAAGPRVSLPSYPWQRQRYWFDQLEATPPPAAAAAPIGEHPLLGPRVDIAGDGDTSTHVWQLEASATSPAYLSDHRVNGVIVWPGAAAIEMARAAAAQVWNGTSTQIIETRFTRLLPVPDDGVVHLQAKLQRRGDAGEFQLFSRSNAGSAWNLNVSARVAAARQDRDGAPRVAVDDLCSACTHTLAAADFYAVRHAAGLQYGPSFRLLEDIRAGNGQSLARLRPPADGGPYRLHPAVLDSAFQAVAAALQLSATSEWDSAAPESVGAVRVHDGAGAAAWVHARMREGPADAPPTADIVLLTASGEVHTEIEGFTITRLARPHRAPDLLVDAWVESPTTSTADSLERWLLLSDRAGVAEALAPELRARGHYVATVSGGAAFATLGPERFQARPGVVDDLKEVLAAIDGCTRVACLRGLDDPSALSAPEEAVRLSTEALSLVQAAALAASPPRLWLVTQGAMSVAGEDASPPLGSIAGIALTANLEHPELACTHVDLDTATPERAAACLLREMTAADGERTVAWRQDQRYAARLARDTDSERPAPGTLRQDATYLITGGLGALGLITAGMLVEAGARHLLLIGRRGLDHHDAGVLARVDALRSAGASISVLAADIASPDIARHLDDVLAGAPALAGVIHAAGVLSDAPVLRQTSDGCAQVFGPKAAGAWNLHVYTRGTPLDFFVCYSSAASMIGSPGQANYAAANAFVDALAVHRRAQGLPALAINWGPWESGGMAANDRTRLRLAARGISPLTDAEGAAILRALLGPTAATRVGVIAADWNLVVRQFTAGTPPLFERLAGAGRSALPIARSSSRQEAAGQSLEDVVRAELAAVLGFRDGTAIGFRDRFFELGMDSLTSLEFKNALQGRLQVTLPATLVFEYGSLDLLVAHLGTLLGASAPGAAAAAALPVDALSDAELLAALTRELDGEPA